MLSMLKKSLSGGNDKSVKDMEQEEPAGSRDKKSDGTKTKRARSGDHHVKSSKKHKLERQRQVTPDITLTDDGPALSGKTTKASIGADYRSRDASTSGDSSSSSDEFSSEESSETENEDAVPIKAPDMPDDTPAWGLSLLGFMKTEFEKVCEENKEHRLSNRRTRKKLEDKIENIAKKLVTVEDQFGKTAAENLMLKEKILDLEYRQRRNNLLFEGVMDEDGETSKQYKDKLLKILKNIKTLNMSTLSIEHCHRLGATLGTYPRQVICCFTCYSDVAKILSNRKALPHAVFVNEDLPEEWKDRRHALRPIYSAAKADSELRNKTTWSKDRLVINSKTYSFAPRYNLHELSDVINIGATCEKPEGDLLVFQGIHSIYSNFYPASFRFNGINYCSMEQFIQSEKAKLFDNDTVQFEIMNTSSAYKAKHLGGRVRHFDRNKWETHFGNYAFYALLEKFKQNPVLRENLLGTGRIFLAESTPDQLWGTGLSLKHDDALHKESWHTNGGLMSKLLLRVREELKSSK